MASKGNPYKHKGGGGRHRVADRAALIEADRVAAQPAEPPRDPRLSPRGEQRRAEAARRVAARLAADGGDDV